MAGLRVCHIINGLAVGGAEMMLFKLLKQLNGRDCHSSVISLTKRGPVADRIAELGVPVTNLGMRFNGGMPAAFLRLVRALRAARPDVVQTWLYHADLLGGLACRLVARDLPVIWGIRIASLRQDTAKRTTLWTRQICASLSGRLPHHILINSAFGQREHESLGYSSQRMTVIPNGFDLDEFRPSVEARITVRRNLGLPHDAPLVGAVGRYHRQKNYPNLVAAAGRILQRLPDVHFVFCGRNVTWDNPELRLAIAQTNQKSHFHLLGERLDTNSIQASFDVAILASCCEGFPNVVGEAMACGVPCVVTDVGGSAEVVGDTGRIVPPRNPAALADACLEILCQPVEQRKKMGQLARQRMEQHFSIDRIAEQYLAVWQEAHARRRPATPRSNAGSQLLCVE